MTTRTGIPTWCAACSQHPSQNHHHDLFSNLSNNNCHSPPRSQQFNLAPSDSSLVSLEGRALQQTVRRRHVSQGLNAQSTASCALRLLSSAMTSSSPPRKHLYTVFACDKKPCYIFNLVLESTFRSLYTSCAILAESKIRKSPQYERHAHSKLNRTRTLLRTACDQRVVQCRCVSTNSTRSSYMALTHWLRIRSGSLHNASVLSVLASSLHVSSASLCSQLPTCLLCGRASSFAKWLRSVPRGEVFVLLSVMLLLGLLANASASQ